MNSWGEAKQTKISLVAPHIVLIGSMMMVGDG